jgi:hypothetical protein
MPDPVTALVVGGTSLASSAVGSKAAKSAGQLQYDASQAGIAETRAAREEMRTLLQPYVAAGGPALQAQMAALGLAGPEAQQAYVTQQEQNPLFQSLARQQEEAILQNASATGGLRGGNVQGALAQFRPALLNQFLEQQYGRLGGMTSLGQQSAAGVGTAGMQSAGSIADLLAQGGAARAGAKLGSANAWQQSLSLPAQFAGLAIGRGY